MSRGRHVRASDPSFRRSLLRAIAGGLVAVAAAVAVTILLANIGRDRGAGEPAVPSGEATSTRAAPPLAAAWPGIGALVTLGTGWALRDPPRDD
ncbi:MAG: hypothetical protein H0V19_03360 [Euzebyales bacterium]|nr:hypothetical protein [Euzebyales bacterium]